jgi:ketosteroid isomerase-like protein
MAARGGRKDFVSRRFKIHKLRRKIEMKLFTSLLAIAALSFAASAFAQEESPSAAPQETASASVEASASTPTATPETKASPTTEALPVSSPAAKKKEAPPAQKKESTEAAPSKKEKAAAPAGPDKGSAESNVKRLEDEWEAAVMKHDATFVQTRVAEDYVGTSSKGKRISKGGLLKEFKGDTDTYTSTKNAGVAVRSFGANIAIATGTAREVGKGKDGKAFNRVYAWTDTWMLRNGKWECIGSQSMLVSGK